MLSKLNLSFLALAVALLVSACASEDKNVRDTALQSLSPNNAMTPDSPIATGESDAPVAPVGPTTTMTFDEMTFDFGTVNDGEKVRHAYKFKNTGTEPLVISNATGSCGCTVPQWPQTPIAPGATGEIMVEFDSKNKPGRQTKTVTITANTNPVTTRLTITGEVAGGAAVQ